MLLVKKCRRANVHYLSKSSPHDINHGDYWNAFRYYKLMRNIRLSLFRDSFPPCELMYHTQIIIDILENDRRMRDILQV